MGRDTRLRARSRAGRGKIQGRKGGDPGQGGRRSRAGRGKIQGRKGGATLKGEAVKHFAPGKGRGGPKGALKAIGPAPTPRRSYFCVRL